MLRVVHQDKVEFYDHVNDPFETRNVADHPTYRKVVQEMETKMIAGWRDAMKAVPRRRSVNFNAREESDQSLTLF